MSSNITNDITNHGILQTKSNIIKHCDKPAKGSLGGNFAFICKDEQILDHIFRRYPIFIQYNTFLSRNMKGVRHTDDYDNDDADDGDDNDDDDEGGQASMASYCLW